MEKLLVFNIKHYALHDGPGIRTTVFLKGCPLICPWCHNPESRSTEVYKYIKTEQFRGTDIFETHTIGKYYSFAELFSEIEKDRILYEQSGGGITFSGGEPMMQSEALIQFLKLCKAQGLHTCVDTTGYCSEHSLLRVSEYTDLFHYDLKLPDEKSHRTYTGVSNRKIIRNLKILDQANINLRIRIPLIPGVNDNETSIQGFIDILSSLENSCPVDILPYHKLGSHKNEQFSLSENVIVFDEPPKKLIQAVKEKFKKHGFNIAR
ncbi:MAG: glycyl-radical enzyme activating protein [Bacteroidota bacterium]|nr:glycyl-radical enzyme activating protein [Bacteroidota bacterium]